MVAIEPLCHLLNINNSKLSKQENLLLEAKLFTYICEELKVFFSEKLKDYFRLMKFTKKQENAMLEANFICLIIGDILASEEYNLEGIARYTDTHEDVVIEVFEGRNTSPSATFLRRLIELHHTVRHNLYLSIMKKITSEYSPTC